MNAQLQKVVDLPFFTVFSDGARPSTATVIEISWHPDNGPNGRIRLTAQSLRRFIEAIELTPPATVVRAIFQVPEFRAGIAEVPGFEVLD